jgi:quercetin dioxygenase-like cupin family protein
MSGKYPEKIKSLPLFDGRFDAYKLEATDSDVLFASYPAGTSIPPHTHDTDNHGVITRGELILTMDGVVSKVVTGDWYHVPANVEHSARFEVETDEIEFWFKVNT